MNKKYGDQVQFYFVYTREAHAIDSDRPMSRSAVEQPLSTQERRKVAQAFLKDAKLEMPALLDGIDDAAATAYASLPDRMYLVGQDGKIAYAGGRGPWGFKPDDLASAIEKEVKRMESKPAVKAPTAAEKKMAAAELMKTIDADGNGVLSKAEITGAATALNALDSDKDGQVDVGELMPKKK